MEGVQEFYLVAGPDGARAHDGTLVAEGIAVGHILYNPEHPYDPPEGTLLVPVEEFTGTVYTPPAAEQDT